MAKSVRQDPTPPPPPPPHPTPPHLSLLQLPYVFQLPMPGHGKSIKSSSKPITMSFNSKPSALADRSRPAIAGGDSRHLSVLQNPNIAHAQTKFELRTPQSSSTSAQNETVTVQKTSKNITTTNEIIKLCIKMPNSAREILTVKSSATFNQILTMIQKKKRFKEPEFITSDVPAKRISGNKLALSLIDFGIENNSVLHCDELL